MCSLRVEPEGRIRILNRSRILATCAVLLCALAAAPAAFASVIYVDASATTGADDGSSWADAFQGPSGLRRALATAVDGDEIWVADGTYLPTLAGVRTRSFDLKTGVKLYGGFAGGETSVLQRNPAVHLTVLSGDLAGDDGAGSHSDNSYHVVVADGVGAEAVLDGFTIHGGNANGAPSEGFDRGGGLYIVNYSQVPIRQCIIRANRCTFRGGAVFALNLGELTFEDCLFADNLAGSSGGAVYLNVGNDFNPFIRCTFSGNSAPRGSVADLAVAYDVFFIECLFHANVATGQGGLVTVQIESYPWFIGSTVVGNSSLVGQLAGPVACGVHNSILYFNTGPGGSQTSQNQVGQGCDSITASHSCVQGGLAGTNMISTDPLFVDVNGGDFRLAAASPCIDSGDNARESSLSALDLERTPRYEDVPSVSDTGAGTLPIVDMGAYETPGGLYDAFCAGDGSLPTPCPCGNTDWAGRGCRNSHSDSALLAAGGTASPDTVVLTASEVPANALSIFLQGNAAIASGVVFGDGVRCVSGALKRIGTKNATSPGIVSYPGASDPSVSARSAALGDTIQPGTDRWYQTWYRDSSPTFCPPPLGGTSNVSSGAIVHW